MNERLKKIIEEKGCIKETMIRFPSLTSVEIMAQAGFDLLTIDAEHYPFNHESIQNIVRVVHAAGQMCGMRVPFYEPSLISHFMDYGLDYILVPHVESKEQAEGIVSAVKFAPLGKRGLCPITKAAAYGSESVETFVQRSNQDCLVMLMVETKTGLENIDAILQVPGVDIISIGPSDVSASFGVPGQIDHPLVRQAIETAQKKILKNHVLYNAMVSSAEDAARTLERGHRCFHIASDLQLMKKGLQRLESDLPKSTPSRLSLKEKMKKRIPAIVSMHRMASEEWAELMSLSRLDGVILDLEHYAFDRERVQSIIRTIRARGKAALVRVSRADKPYLPLLMDMGASGILYPNLQSAEEAREIIDLIKFAPEGMRGYCPISRAATYGSAYSATQYPEVANRESIIGVMIESPEGLKALPEVLTMKEIDFISIGASDISASLGQPGVLDEKVKDIMNEIERLTLESDKALECSVNNREDIKNYLAMGGSLFYYLSDQQILMRELRLLIEEVTEVAINNKSGGNL